VGGTGEGKTLVTIQPINFLAMVNAKTGTIIDPLHEPYGKSLKGSVLIVPYGIGSSVGAYTIYSKNMRMLQVQLCVPKQISLRPLLVP
jgi:uncharacterized protein